MQRSSYAVLVALICSACAVPDNVRSVESADFHFASEIELRQRMQSMADRIGAIAKTSMSQDLTLENQQDIVLPLLDEIETIATEIDGASTVTNYSVINQYMGAFLYDVTVARQFALKSPPNLLPARRLIKSCLSCHESI